MQILEAQKAKKHNRRFTLPKHGKVLNGDLCEGKGIIVDIGENRPYETADSQPASYPAIQLACTGNNCGMIFLATLEQFPVLESIRYQTDSDFFSNNTHHFT